jgi:TorA maturation chaperone TorD
MNMIDFIERETFRAEVYRLLSVCFYLPCKRTIETEGIMHDLVRLLETVCPEAVGHARSMESECTAYDEEYLKVDHAKLFVGPFELQAPPYGSVYLDSQKSVMGDTTMQVLEMYQEAGLSLSDALKEPPDHIAVELEFMYYLCGKEIGAFEPGDPDEAYPFMRMQYEFHNRYLSPWIGPFCESIRENTENRFYRALADCLETFLSRVSVPDGVVPERSFQLDGWAPNKSPCV